jgi:peptidase M3-like protein
VRDAAGRHRGLFFGDYFARPSKHSGAWMTRLRDREKLKGDIRPLVVNVMNFSKASDGEPDAAFVRRRQDAVPRIRSRFARTSRRRSRSQNPFNSRKTLRWC